jgi:hypothetical protein
VSVACGSGKALPSDNTGLYRFVFEPELNYGWYELDQGYWSSTANAPPEPGDVIVTPPASPKGTQDCPDKMPEVVVTATPPRSGSRVVVRYYASSSGSSRHREPPAFEEVQAANITCAYGHEERKGAALDAIRPLRFLPAGSVIRVNYAQGHSQLWTVMLPYATDRGLTEASSCRSPSG